MYLVLKGTLSGDLIAIIATMSIGLYVTTCNWNENPVNSARRDTEDGMSPLMGAVGAGSLGVVRHLVGTLHSCPSIL